jgi:RNA polymerase sigma-70 factor (ECF subfamily)
LAVAEVHGAAAGLDALEAVTDRRITEYQPYWAARAELFSRTGAYTEAHKAYEVAIGLEPDPAVTLFLRQRQSALSI